MTEKPSGERKGLLESLAALASTLVAIAHTRLDLLSVDIEEDRARFLSLLLLALTTLFLIGVGVVLAIILLVLVFWDTHRVLALSSLAGFFLVAGLATWAFAIHQARTKPRLFTSSLLELVKDRQQLASRI